MRWCKCSRHGGPLGALKASSPLARCKAPLSRCDLYTRSGHQETANCLCSGLSRYSPYSMSIVLRDVAND